MQRRSSGSHSDQCSLGCRRPVGPPGDASHPGDRRARGDAPANDRLYHRRIRRGRLAGERRGLVPIAGAPGAAVALAAGRTRRTARGALGGDAPAGRRAGLGSHVAPCVVRTAGVLPRRGTSGQPRQPGAAPAAPRLLRDRCLPSPRRLGRFGIPCADGRSAVSGRPPRECDQRSALAERVPARHRAPLVLDAPVERIRPALSSGATGLWDPGVAGDVRPRPPDGARRPCSSS